MKLYKLKNLINKGRVVELRIDGVTVYVGGWCDIPSIVDRCIIVNIIAKDCVLLLELEG